MNFEIGSEFWDIDCLNENSLFPPETQWFISGRSALKAIISENNFKVVAIPDWCCDSMIKPFVDAGIKVLFYPALHNKGHIPAEADCALVMDYFGYTGHSDVRSFEGTVIRDITHSLLSADYNDADYYFGSLRKWSGFYTGGFAWGFKNSVTYDDVCSDFISLRQKAMHKKQLYINKKTFSKDYLDDFDKAEHLLDDIGILPADPRDVSAAHSFNTSEILQKRRKNASILLKELSSYAIFPTMASADCPMFVPIMIKDRDGLRRHLIEKKIYCPKHWPISKYHTDISEETRLIYEEELSLVCDQRYDENDMLRIVYAVKEFLNEENS